MPARKYPKGVAKRDEILDAALPLIARHGYSSATLRELADTVGISQTGVLHHFGSREQLFTDILRRRDETNTAEFTTPHGSPDLDTLQRSLARLLTHNATVPGLAELYAGLAGDATTASHSGHEYFQTRYDTTREQMGGALRAIQGHGDLDTTLDPDVLASLLIAVMDGLQLQWLYNPNVEMVSHLNAFVDLIRRSSSQTATEAPTEAVPGTQDAANEQITPRKVTT